MKTTYGSTETGPTFRPLSNWLQNCGTNSLTTSLIVLMISSSKILLEVDLSSCRAEEMTFFVHSNGENTCAGPLQLDIQTASKHIAKAVALGHSKPCVSLLIELHGNVDGTDDKIRQEMWDTVKEINEKYPGHSRIMRSMVYVLPPGSSLPVTPKGSVKRNEVERLYAGDISKIYQQLEGGSPARTTARGITRRIT